MSLQPRRHHLDRHPAGRRHGDEAADLPQGRRRDRARHRGPRRAAPGLHRRSRTEPAMLPLLDTHQHLIYPDRLRLRAGRRARRRWRGGPSALEDYQALTARRRRRGHDLHGGAVDHDDYRAEARDGRRRSRAQPGSGILGHHRRRCRPETDAGFEAWLDEGPGARRRRLPAHPARDDRTTCRGRETFRANIRRIGARGPAVRHVLPRPPAADRAGAGAGLPGHRARARPLRQCPTSPPAAVEPWRDGLAALAAMPNVVAKLSGVYRQRRAGHGEPRDGAALRRGR